MLMLVQEGFGKKNDQDRLNYSRQLKKALEEFTEEFLPHMKQEEEVRGVGVIILDRTRVYQGTHGTGKTGKMAKNIPSEGKHREFVNFAKTQGKHREFCLRKL